MGMVGQIYVRPQQDHVPNRMTLYTALQLQQTDPRTACQLSSNDILCTNPLPIAGDNGTKGAFAGGTAHKLYAYNDSADPTLSMGC